MKSPTEKRENLGNQDASPKACKILCFFPTVDGRNPAITS